MKALTIENGILALSDKPVPAQKDEALVRVVKSGICNTDLEIVRGYAGFEGTIGHEFVGIVEEYRTQPDLVGKRVVGEINVGCTKCEWCKTHDARHCPNRTVLGIINRDGCHAEYLNLPARNLVRVPDSVSDDEAVFAEPLAAAYGITEQLSFTPETRVAVIGDGKLGILCAWALSSKIPRLFLIGKHPNKLATAETQNVEGVLLENAAKLGRNFVVVVEASGSESGFETALGLLKPRGRLVLKSTFHGKASWEAWRVVVDEITIIGSRCGVFSPAMGLLENKALDVKKLITEEFPLSSGLRALETASKSETLKVVLSMGV